MDNKIPNVNVKRGHCVKKQFNMDQDDSMLICQLNKL